MPFPRLALSLILLKLLSAAADITLGEPVPIYSDFVDYIRDVPAGCIVVCSITDGFYESVDVDLVMSATSGAVSTCDDGLRSCSVGPLNAVSEITVTVSAFYADATLTCIKTTPTAMRSGVPITIPNLEIDSNFVGILSRVPANSQVTCTLDGDNGQNEDGREDSDLYIDMYSSDGEVSECTAISTLEDEACSLAATDVTSKVTVRVHAFLEFSDVTVLCNVCSFADAPCSSASNCCGDLVCDGPRRSSKKCKIPVAPGGRCSRTSQCSEGYCCKSSRCVPL